MNYFSQVRIKANQSDKSINIPVSRSGSTDGEIKVGWSTSCPESSPYFNLSGTETFEDGDGVSHIKMELPELPQASETDTFTVVLSARNLERNLCKLGSIFERPVEIKNDVSYPVIELSSNDKTINQTDGTVDFLILRKKQSKGRIIVPWKLLPEDGDSIYSGVKGKCTLEEGQVEGKITVQLSQNPLPQHEENFTFQLQQLKILF